MEEFSGKFPGSADLDNLWQVAMDQLAQPLVPGRSCSPDFRTCELNLAETPVGGLMATGTFWTAAVIRRASFGVQTVSRRSDPGIRPWTFRGADRAVCRA